jgi:5-amino-6-(5-phosphoribosylamino)uracil reductase
VCGRRPRGVGQDRLVPDRPYVLLSAAMSVDGRIDDTAPGPLLLSDAADLDRVDEVRAGVDAILVGATTLRRDDPRLLVRSPERRAARVAAGRDPDPLKVTLTGSGELDPAARFFTTGAGPKLVYAATAAVGAARRAVGPVADVADAGEPLDLHRLLADLRARGVARLMVEGGTAVHTLFLTAGVVDELQLVVAPFFVGDADAPRFVGPGRFPHDTAHRMRLAQARPIGDLVLLRYLLEGA